MSNVTFIGSAHTNRDTMPDMYMGPANPPPDTETVSEPELPSLLLPMAVLSAGFFAWELLT